MAHPIPDAALEGDIAILGRKGGGKSFTAKGIVERLLDMKRRVLVLDPLGVWAGLRTSADGKRPGYPIAIFGGEHADLPLDPAAAEPLARVVAAENLPAVIDLSELSKTAQSAFLLKFLHELRRANREALTIVLEEADVFCLSEDTEILAKRGWLRWSDIVEGEPVACFNVETSEYEYGPVQRIISRFHDGEMVHLKSKGLDYLATPDHRVVMRRYHRGNHSPRGLRDWCFVPADEVPTSIGIPLGGAPFGPGVPGLSEQMARILGWVITDGSVHDKRQERRAFAIEQSSATIKGNVAIGDEMDSVLMSLPGVTRYDRAPRETGSGGRMRKHAASRRWYIAGDVAAEIAEWLGDDIHRIPRLIIENGSREQLSSLFQGLLEGDGTFQGRWSNFYPCQNESLADNFQEIALRLGVNATKVWSASIGQWYVCLAPSRPHHWVRRPGRAYYRGVVWDVTVPTGAFVARRNGRAFVTGNCPQNPQGDDSKALHGEIDWISRRGRFRGFRLISICQRPARISKDVLTQANMLIMHRLPAPQDRDAAKAWVDGNGDRDQSKVVFDTLSNLAVGEAWVLAQEPVMLERVKFPLIKTLDTSATPKAGARRIEPKTLAQVDVSAIRAAMKIVDNEKPGKIDQKAIEAAEDRGFRRGYDDGFKVGRDIGSRTGAHNQMLRVIDSMRAAAMIVGDGGVLDRAYSDMRAIKIVDDDPGKDPVVSLQTAPAQKVQDPPRKAAKADVEKPDKVPTSNLPASLQRALNSVVWWHSIGFDDVSRTRAAVTAGLSPKASTFGVYVAKLIELGYLETGSPGAVKATALGMAVGVVPDGVSIVGMARALLDPQPARIFDLIVKAYPNAVKRDEIAEAMGLSPKASTLGVYPSKISRFGFIESRPGGRVVAADFMFVKN